MTQSIFSRNLVLVPHGSWEAAHVNLCKTVPKHRADNRGVRGRSWRELEPVGKCRVPQAQLLKAGFLFRSTLHGQMLTKESEGLEISNHSDSSPRQRKKATGTWAASSKGFNHSYCPITLATIHPTGTSGKLRPWVWSPGQ